MTTLEGRPNTALLVIDAQNAILAERGEMPLSGIRWRRER